MLVNFLWYAGNIFPNYQENMCNKNSNFQTNLLLGAEDIKGDTQTDRQEHKTVNKI